MLKPKCLKITEFKDAINIRLKVYTLNSIESNHRDGHKNKKTKCEEFSKHFWFKSYDSFDVLQFLLLEPDETLCIKSTDSSHC